MKVWPKDEAMRKLLKHPVAGAFHEEGPSEWPDDQFTTRRLRDGDVTLAEPKAEQQPSRSKTTKEQ
jgi:hypothetical protein